MALIASILECVQSGDERQAEAAVQSLAGLPEQAQLAALAELREQLAEPDPDRRWWAVRALAELPLAQTHSLLAQALQDQDASIRQCASLGVRLQFKQAVNWESVPGIRGILLPGLVSRLDDPDPLAARLAADALAAAGGAAVPPLLELMEKGSRAARLLAVRALAEIADERAIPALLAALDGDSLLMEYWATQGLDKLGVGMAYFFP